MKKLKLFMFGVLLSQIAFAQTRNYHIEYKYDNAGNLVQRIKRFDRKKAKELQEDDVTAVNSIENGKQIKIKADATWSKVQIDITGELSQNDVLSIYGAEGILFTTVPLETNSLSLNLSKLHKGTYIFKFNVNNKSSERKIIKVY